MRMTFLAGVRSALLMIAIVDILLLRDHTIHQKKAKFELGLTMRANSLPAATQVMPSPAAGKARNSTVQHGTARYSTEQHAKHGAARHSQNIGQEQEQEQGRSRSRSRSRRRSRSRSWSRGSAQSSCMVLLTLSLELGRQPARFHDGVERVRLLGALQGGGHLSRAASKQASEQASRRHWGL